MRRVAGVVLIALGVFAITLGFTLRFVVLDRLALAPLDPDTETVAQGTGVTVFYPKALADPSIPRTRTDATVTARRVVGGKLDAPEVKVNGAVALWRVGLVVEDERSNLINAVEQWVCVDRRTAQGVSPCSQRKVDDGTQVDTDADQKGLEYKFPFGTQQKDYTFFDVTLHAATPIRYDGAEKINGLETYRFVQRIDPSKLEDREVPGDLVNGAAGTSVTATRYYQNIRTVWAEPYTGIIVKGQEQVRQVLRGPDGRDGTVLLAGTLTFTPQTVQRQVADAKDSRAKVRMLKETGPILAWVLGGFLVIGGLVLLLVRPKAGAPAARNRGRRRASEKVTQPV
jgi:hypothetical protein